MSLFVGKAQDFEWVSVRGVLNFNESEAAMWKEND